MCGNHACKYCTVLSFHIWIFASIAKNCAAGGTLHSMVCSLVEVKILQNIDSCFDLLDKHQLTVLSKLILKYSLGGLHYKKNCY